MEYLGELDFENPHPCIHGLFAYYNDLYFDGQLGACSLKWSTKRMTLCAGVCHYSAFGGCHIRLSEPILKFRPVSDLKNTLLHEMIHAYLCLTNGNKDHDDHGPCFQNMMMKINDCDLADEERPAQGYGITVYHKFADEVEFYRNHHWKCTICGDLIKRAMNRTPSVSDCVVRSDTCAVPNCHWHKHQKLCGGSYEKIHEPVGYVDNRKHSALRTLENNKQRDPCGDHCSGNWTVNGQKRRNTDSRAGISKKGRKEPTVVKFGSLENYFKTVERDKEMILPKVIIDVQVDVACDKSIEYRNGKDISTHDMDIDGKSHVCMPSLVETDSSKVKVEKTESPNIEVDTSFPRMECKRDSENPAGEEDKICSEQRASGQESHIHSENPAGVEENIDSEKPEAGQECKIDSEKRAAGLEVQKDSEKPAPTLERREDSRDTFTQIDEKEYLSSSRVSTRSSTRKNEVQAIETSLPSKSLRRDRQYGIEPSSSVVPSRKKRLKTAGESHENQNLNQPLVILAWANWASYENDEESEEPLIDKRSERKKRAKELEPVDVKADKVSDQAKVRDLQSAEEFHIKKVSDDHRKEKARIVMCEEERVTATKEIVIDLSDDEYDGDGKDEVKKCIDMHTLETSLRAAVEMSSFDFRDSKAKVPRKRDLKKPVKLEGSTSIRPTVSSSVETNRRSEGEFQTDVMRCPICSVLFKRGELNTVVNQHIDECLGQQCP